MFSKSLDVTMSDHSEVPTPTTFHAKYLHTSQQLQHILSRMEKGNASPDELENYQSRKTILRHKDFSGHAARIKLRSAGHVPTDFIIQQSRYFPKTDALSILEETEARRQFTDACASSSSDAFSKGSAIEQLNSKTCSRLHKKGKAVLQANELELLTQTLMRLEEETESMRQTFLETLREKRKLEKDVYQQFQTLQHCLLPNDQEKEQSSSVGPLVIQPPKYMQENPSPSTAARDCIARNWPPI